MTNSSGAGVGYLTGVSPSSLLPVVVENLQDAGAMSRLNVVLVGSPDWLSILTPTDVDVFTACKRDLKT